MKKIDKYSLLTAEDIRRMFDYEPLSGLLRCKHNGVIAGYNINTGYRAVKINGIQYVIHRIIWLHVYGQWPSDQIDHIDRNKSNNRLENLRLATLTFNRANCRVHKNNFLGKKGIQIHKATGKYRARICVKGKHISLGLHHKIEDAIAAYTKAAKVHFGEYARIS